MHPTFETNIAYICDMKARKNNGQPKPTPKASKTPDWVVENVKKLPQASSVEIKKDPYKPSKAVTNVKAALAVASSVPAMRKYASAAQAGADLYTAGRHAMSGNYKDAKADLLQAGAQMAISSASKKTQNKPFLKATDLAFDFKDAATPFLEKVGEKRKQKNR
jgi:hypothetical protein